MTSRKVWGVFLAAGIPVAVWVLRPVRTAPSALGQFKARVMRFIQRRIRDLQRKKHYQAGDKKFSKEEALDTAILATTWERIRSKANPKDYQIFHLHVRKGLAVKVVAGRLGVPASQVYIAKHRISALLKKEIKGLARTGF